MLHTLEERIRLVKQLHLMDDLLFQKVAEDPEVCQEILRILLQKPTLHVIEAQPQRFLRNIGAHSVILDLLCRDANGDFFAVEVQKADDDHHQKRVRFNISNVDTSLVEKGIPYRELPDVYAIFLSRFDPFHEQKTIYHVDRSLRETGSKVDNGIHELYVNTTVNDGTEIAELMQYFLHSCGTHPKFQKLSQKVHYYKEQQEGVISMSDIVEEYAKKYAEQYAKEKICEAKAEAEQEQKNTILRLLKRGTEFNVILDAFPSFSLNDLQQLQKQLPQA